MSRAAAARLAEVLDIVQRHGGPVAVFNAGEVDQRIEQHRGVTLGQHEAVAVHPLRGGRIVAQIPLPQRVGGRRGPIGVPG